MKESKRQE